MTEYDEKILLQELCARMPYGVKVQGCKEGKEFTGEVVQINIETEEISVRVPSLNALGVFKVNDVKPLLYPISNIPKHLKEIYELTLDWTWHPNDSDKKSEKTIATYKFCMQNHIDINGLIE